MIVAARAPRRPVRVLVAALAAALSLAPGVASAARPAGDPYRAAQWPLDRIGVPGAWERSTGKGVVVAVLDTGADLTHPDLVRNLLVLPGADVADPKGCLDNGCVDDGPHDPDGHGTAMAGIVGARRGNGVGIAGVAPDVKIMPVRVNSPHAFSPRTIAEGVRFAVRNGADVISMSFAFADLPYAVSKDVSAFELVTGETGMADLHTALDDAAAAGVVLVAAAGNGYPTTSDLDDPSLPVVGAGKPECGVPALHPAVICVGAVDRADRHTYYSDLGVTDLERFLVAPSGTDVGGGPLPVEAAPCEDRVATTYPRGDTRACPGGLADGYTFLSGTSSSTAYVAGVAALLVSRTSGDRAVAALLGTAEDLGAPGTDPLYGRGLVDATAALRSLS